MDNTEILRRAQKDLKRAKMALLGAKKCNTTADQIEKIEENQDKVQVKR